MILISPESGTALGVYERARNERVLPIYELTCQLATIEPPPPEMQRLFAAMRGNQEAVDHFAGVLAGSAPLPEFFSPANVERIMAQASPAGAHGQAPGPRSPA